MRHVNADDGLAVWLANRHIINDFPDRLDDTCYVVLDSGMRTSAARPTPTSGTRRSRRCPTSGRRLLYDDGTFQVWSPVGDQ